MSLTTWAKKNSKGLAKTALYATGGVLIGYPAIKFATNLWHGSDLQSATNNAVYNGTGYVMDTGALDTAMTRNAVIRTGIGALAVYAARKI